mgnify:CR=1 FL=1
MAPQHISAHCDNYLTATNTSTAEGQKNFEILMQADIVFFNGGDQSRHARTWLLDSGDCNYLFCQLFQRFKNNQVIFAGTSAGTMIMSTETYGEGISFGQLYFSNKVGLAPKRVADGSQNGTGLKDDRKGQSGLQWTDNGGYTSGFPALGNSYQTDSHFDARGRLVRLIPALFKFKRQYGIGVDEDTVFYVDGNQATVYGSHGVFFVDITNATAATTEYFSCKGVRVSYLTSGDKLDLTTKKLTSSKP